MHPDWRTFLESAGATLADDRVLHFGDPQTELTHAAHDDTLLDLSPLSLVRVSGTDAGSFLSGQLTQDVRRLDATHHQIAAYCTPQGRMLAILRLFQRDQTYYLQLPRSLRDATIERLRRYVLRAKMKLEADETLITIGIAGPNSTQQVARALGQAPAAPGECVTQTDVTVLHLPGAAPRFVVVGTEPQMRALWDEWKRESMPVGSNIWEWFDIRAGLPSVFPATIEAFVPQMTNLDLIGGISLDKGCYPGQEIVARMHYLGRLKQRMYRARIESTAAPQPGDAIYAPLLRGQSTGTVVAAHASPDGGFEMLAVIQIEATETEADKLHWKKEDGPLLEILPLPYSLPHTASPASG